MSTNRHTKFFMYAAGIFIFYFYYGMLQEKITKGQYGDERFTYMFALVCFQCIVNYVFAKISLLTVMKQGEDTTSTSYYALAALTYLLAMVCSNMALQFVSYPTQVIGKAGKPIPVMILGVLIGNKVYPLRKYAFVLLVVTGVVLFMYKDGGASAKQADTQTWFGELLLLLSLTMDGLISATQERMRAEHKTKSNHMMLNMNIWSVLYSSVVILISGELFEFIKFLQRHPATIWHILSFSVAGACGQNFIYLMVAEFGPLPCSIVTTTRKFFTVLASILFFGNNLSNKQWTSVFLVFTGLFLDAMYGKNSPNRGLVKQNSG